MNILKEAQQSMITLFEGESACRGYLITSDKNFLEPYSSYHQNMLAHLTRLKDLMKENHSQVEIVNSLYDLVSQISQLTETRVISHTQKIDSETLAPSLQKSKAIMNQFSKTIKQIISSEDIILERKQHAIKNWRLALLCAISSFGAWIVFFIFWTSMTNRRYEREQVAITLALNKAREEAISANRLKSHFVANVSHEIRTPLSGILGLSELLTGFELTTEATELVSHIYISAQSLVGLVNQILDFSRLESGKIELYRSRFTLSEAVNKVLASCKAEAESKGLSLLINIDKKLEELELFGDSGRVRQVLLNLLYNSIKFTGTGSVALTITKDHEEENQIFVRFEIADTGIGIDEENKQSLFEPFVQADGSTTRKYGGTGLGLSICLNLVHLMQGTIDCAKNANGGATFWFTLPFEISSDAAETNQAAVT